MRVCFLLEPLEPRITLSAGFIATDGIPGGAITFDFNGRAPEFPSFAFQPNGKLLASDRDSSSDCGTFLLRFNPDGSRDRDFGAKTPTQLCDSSGLHQLLALRDGSFYAVSMDGVFHFNPDGRMDSSFTSDAALANMDFIDFIAPTGDGHILVAGEIWTDDFATTPSQLALFRLNSDGAPDLSFGASGALAEQYASPFYSAWDLIVQPDGKILVQASDGDGYHANVLRFNADGTPDDSFATHGQFSFGPDDYVGPMLLQPDGKIVEILDTLDVTLTRLNPDGPLDHSFGHDGRTSYWWHKYHYWDTAFLQPDGKIIAIAEDNLIARFNSNGSLDSSFGFGGSIKIISPDPHFDYILDNAVLRGDHLLLFLLKGTLNSDGDWKLFSSHLLDITTSSNGPSNSFSADGNFMIVAPDSPLLQHRSFPVTDDATSWEIADQSSDDAPTPQDSIWDDSHDPLDWEVSADLL